MCATTAWAQQRPLVTEDPEVIGAGRLLVEVGMDYGRQFEFPASGLTGNLLRVPLVGVSVGLSSIAEIQIDSGYNLLSITDRIDAPLSDVVTVDGDSTSAVEDIVVATKIRLVGESGGRPSIGVRVRDQVAHGEQRERHRPRHHRLHCQRCWWARPPIASGWSATWGSASWATRCSGGAQNDVLTYGLSVARAFTDRAEFVGEVNGRLHTASTDPPPGTESRGQFRFGARYTVGPGRVDGAVIVGLTPRDPSVGFAVGYTHVFDAFRLP